MKLMRPARGPHSETIIALIDVVLFLLIFFMLIGRMDATAPFDVSPPLALTGRDMPAGGATLSIAADGAMALDGRALDRDGLTSALTAMLKADPALWLRVNAHRDAELRHVLPLVAEAEALGVRDVVLVVTPRPGP